MSATHTPGPWQWLTRHDSFILQGADESGILCIREGASPLMANADLIAAAPELLAIGHEIIRARKGRAPKWEVALRKAIAKAEGMAA